MDEQHTVTINLLDESFNPQESRNYGLAIILSEDSISYCTLDFRRNKFLGLCQCSRNEVKIQEGLTVPGAVFRDFLESVYTSNPVLSCSFKSVKIACNGKKSTLIPAKLFDPVEKEQYLKFNFKLDQDEQILQDHLMPLDAWQIFTVPGDILSATKEFFPKSKMVHASGLLIESIWINYKNHINSPHIFLHVQERLFDLMIFDGRKMDYFNTFSFQNQEDVTYYLIFVMEQLNFNPESAPLILLGDVEKVDGLSDLLHQYVRNIETVRRNASYHYSYILNQLPPHACFPLFNFFSCGL